MDWHGSSSWWWSPAPRRGCDNGARHVADSGSSGAACCAVRYTHCWCTDWAADDGHPNGPRWNLACELADKSADSFATSRWCGGSRGVHANVVGHHEPDSAYPEGVHSTGQVWLRDMPSVQRGAPQGQGVLRGPLVWLLHLRCLPRQKIRLGNSGDMSQHGPIVWKEVVGATKTNSMHSLK